MNQNTAPSLKFFMDLLSLKRVGITQYFLIIEIDLQQRTE